MKIALVHDYLLEAGGAERVLRVLSDMYPTAPIYVALAKHGSARELFTDPPHGEASRRIVESPWAPLLKIGRLYSYFRFLLPWIWQGIDLSGYDLVITSCSGYIARGFAVGPKTKVIAYCHTPPRWLYGYDTPTKAQKRWWGQAFLWIVGPFMRYFDYQSAQRVNVWIANSQEVARRIEKFYRRQAVVVYPPIESGVGNRISHVGKQENYYLIVSRITGSKGILEAARAAQAGKFPLKIVGESVDAHLVGELTKLSYVELVGRVDEEELARLYTGAKGFIALARDEDFGMTVVESMSYGTPVLAYDGGGYRETVIPGKTGILITSLEKEAVLSGIKKMERKQWDGAVIRRWAEKFGRPRFEREMRKIVGA